MKTIRALAVLTTISVLPSLFGTYAEAQGWDCRSTLESIVDTDAHLGALLRGIEDWEQSGLRLSKDTAINQFRRGIEQHRSENDPESMLEPERQISWWEQLPAISQNTDRVSVTCGAKLALVGALADKLPEYRQQYTEGGGSDPFAFLMDNFQGSLYIMIASAEHERRRADRSEIDATTLQRGGIWLFSLGWPFCCAYQN